MVSLGVLLAWHASFLAHCRGQSCPVEETTARLQQLRDSLQGRFYPSPSGLEPFECPAASFPFPTSWFHPCFCCIFCLVFNGGFSFEFWRMNSSGPLPNAEPRSGRRSDLCSYKPLIGQSHMAHTYKDIHTHTHKLINISNHVWVSLPNYFYKQSSKSCPRT